MFLFPASPLSLGLPNKPNIFCKPQIDEGIQLLKSHANNINTCKVSDTLCIIRSSIYLILDSFSQFYTLNFSCVAR